MITPILNRPVISGKYCGAGSVRLQSSSWQDVPRVEYEWGCEENYARMLHMVRRAQDIINQTMMDDYEFEVVGHNRLIELYAENTNAYWVEYMKLTG